MIDLDKEITVLKEHQKIAQAVRRAYEKQKHTAKPTKRIETAVQNELPDYSVYYYTEFGQFHLNIRAKRSNYDDQFYMIWSTMSNGNPVPGWEAFERELQRCEPSDTLERIEQEKSKAAPALFVIDCKIAELEDRIKELRSQASAEIAALPIPESATVRKESMFWHNPTIYSRALFSHIWPDTSSRRR